MDEYKDGEDSSKSKAKFEEEETDSSDDLASLEDINAEIDQILSAFQNNHKEIIYFMLITLQKYLYSYSKAEEFLDIQSDRIELIINIINSTINHKVIVISTQIFYLFVEILPQEQIIPYFSDFLQILKLKIDELQLISKAPAMFDLIYQFYENKNTTNIAIDEINLEYLLHLTENINDMPSYQFNGCMIYLLSRKKDESFSNLIFQYIGRYLPMLHDEHNYHKTVSTFLQIISIAIITKLLSCQQIIELDVPNSIVLLLGSERRRFVDLAAKIIGYLAKIQIFTDVSLELIFDMIDHFNSADLTADLIWMMSNLLENEQFRGQLLNNEALVRICMLFHNSCFNVRKEIGLLLIHLVDYISDSSLLKENDILEILLELIAGNEERIVWSGVLCLPKIISIFKGEERVEFLNFLKESLSDSIDNLEERDFDEEYQNSLDIIFAAVDSLE